MASIDTRIDDARRRIDVVITGPIAGPKVGQTVSWLFIERPELTAYDMLYDLSEYTGDVAAEHVEPIVAAYVAAMPDPSVKCRTAFLTTDPHFQYWAGAMDFQFPGRKHGVFRTSAEAEAFLDETNR